MVELMPPVMEISVRFARKALEELNDFCNTYGLSRDGAIRNALSIYTFLKDETFKGGIVILEKKDRKKERLVIK